MGMRCSAIKPSTVNKIEITTANTGRRTKYVSTR
jgi:hypothetical protein